MSEALAPMGMPAEQSLWRLLHLQGQRCTTQELREACEGNYSAEAMVQELHTRGIGARVVRIQTEDLRFLDPPALVQLKDESWLLFQRRNGLNLLLEGLKGVHSVTAASLRAKLSDVAVELIPELPRATSLWHRLGTLLLQRHPVLIQVSAASLIMMLLALIPPQITRVTMDRALPGGAGSLLSLMALGVLLVAAFQAWTGWLRGRTILYIKTRTEAILGRGFLAHLLSLPFSFLNRKTRGQLLQTFAGLGAAQDLLTERALGAALDGVMAGLYLVVMVSTMAAPTVGVVLAALTMVALAVVVGQLQAKAQREEVEAQAEQRGFLVELLSGVAAVKAAGSEDRELREWLGRLSRELSIALRRQRLSLWSDVGLETVRQTLTVVLLVWGGSLVLGGEATIGSLLAFLLMSTGFLGSVLGIIGTYLSYVVLRPQLIPATEVLEVDPQAKPSRTSSRVLTGPLVLENVWFRYSQKDPWVLREFNLEVQVGEKRWIKGPSGFGKSTILRLIAGLYSPELGSISVGGRDPAAAKQVMIYLPQFFQLYGGSILENLRIFSGHAPRERLMEAAQVSGLHAFVSTLPMGYDTVLPPGGATLSGGERQLAALTAVMASDRSLFLLDEALANLDWVTRRWIDRSPWFDGKTVIYASHDEGFGADSVPLVERPESLQLQSKNASGSVYRAT